MSAMNGMFPANGDPLAPRMDAPSSRMETGRFIALPVDSLFNASDVQGCSSESVTRHDPSLGLPPHVPQVQPFQTSFITIPSSQDGYDGLTSPTVVYADWTSSGGPGANSGIAWPSLSQIDPLWNLDGHWKREDICQFEPESNPHALKKTSGPGPPSTMMAYQDHNSNKRFRQKRQLDIGFHKGLLPSKKRRKTSPKHRNVNLNHQQARFCTLWLHDSIDSLLKPKQLKSLGALVNAPEESISSWMNQKLEQLLANPTLEHSGGQAELARVEVYGDNRPTLQSSATGSTDQSIHSDSLEDSSSELSEAQKPVTRKKGRGSPQTPEQKRCHPSTDTTKLSRNDERPFQCTRKCGKTFKVMKNWVRHETKGFPPRGEMCLVGYLSLENDVCSICQAPQPDAEHMRSQHNDETKFSRDGERCGEEFYRPDHLTQHFGNTHKALSERDHKLLKSRARFDTASQFPTWCGFCEKSVGEQKEIFLHIRDHFLREKKCMSDWVDEVENSERPQGAS